LAEIGFTCGLPAGNDDPTNTEANADSPEGTHDPYGGTTYTPGPSPNIAGMGIAGLNRLRSIRRMGALVIKEQQWMMGLWSLVWATLGALLVFAL
jgi:hypothetical protein